MKIAFMSGAYLNAGDFLIVRRCKEILRQVYPKCEITVFPRKNILSEEDLSVINASNVLVLAGGPLYLWNMYPQIMPLTNDLDKIKVPIFAMACGQRLFDAESHNIYNNGFTASTRRLLDRISSDGFPFGCRDIYAAQLLQGMGYHNVMITGCAAWYNFADNYIGRHEVFPQKITHICVSDCDGLRNSNGVKSLEKHSSQDMEEVLQLLLCRYPEAEINVIFHRNMTTAHDRIKAFLNDAGIQYSAICGSEDGFSLYDSCDLHVGFRVHAHIYNLSRHTRSILISEDARGCGVDQTLGLPLIKNYDSRDYVSDVKIMERITKKLGRRNQFIAAQLNSNIELFEQMNWEPYNWAFDRMAFYYKNMMRHVGLLDSLL